MLTNKKPLFDTQFNFDNNLSAYSDSTLDSDDQQENNFTQSLPKQVLSKNSSYQYQSNTKQQYGNMFSLMDQKNNNSPNNEIKYKTELCKTFALMGHCDYGNKCRFAHGKDELQKKSISNNNLFRTRPCKAFNEKMYCPYGSRCHFQHEARSITEIQSKTIYQKKLQLIPQLSKGEQNSLSNEKQQSRLPIFNNICQSNIHSSSSRSYVSNQSTKLF